MPARGPDNCKRDDGQPRVRGEFLSHDKKDREDSDQIKAWARECGYRMFVSLSDWRYAGVALLVKSTCEQVRHSSTRSMTVVALSHHLLSAHPFALLIGSEEASRSSPSRGLASHACNSRIRSAERCRVALYPANLRVLRSSYNLSSLFFLMISSHVSSQLLGVYVPNCGGKGGFDRRRCWDDEMKLFVSAPRCKPLILCGDLNVAPEYHDVSHPKWFRSVVTHTNQSLCKLSSQGKQLPRSSRPRRSRAAGFHTQRANSLRRHRSCWWLD